MLGIRIELQPVRGLFDHPRHPWALLDSMPKPGAKEPLYVMPGRPPDLAALPTGCRFHPRCSYTMSQCRTEESPEQAMVEPTHCQGQYGTAAWRAAEGMKIRIDSQKGDRYPSGVSFRIGYHFISRHTG